MMKTATRGGWLLPVAAVLAAGLSGCPEEDALGPVPDIQDIPQLPDRIITPEEWTHVTVASGPLGLHVEAALTNDGPSLVYFATQGTPGDPCTEIGDEQIPDKVFWDLHYAWEGGGGAWSTEVVDSILYVGGPSGLSFKAAPDGTPSIVTMVGEPAPIFNWCGAHDAALLQRRNGTWSTVIAAQESGDAASTARGSDFGTVVGIWPGLAFDNSGNPAVLYKDTHAGGALQMIDITRADLELAWAGDPTGGGWTYYGIDQNKGAGNYTSILFDDQNRPITLHYNPQQNIDPEFDEYGLWVNRSNDNGATWERVRINSVRNRERPTMLIEPSSGELWIVYYSITDKAPVLARNTDPDNFTSLSEGWTIQRFGDPLYNEGIYPSIAVAPNGTVGVAYYRCGRVVEDTCSTDDDAAVFALHDNGDWTYEVVDPGEDGNCGTNPALAFKSDNSAFIGYQCAVKLDDEGNFGFEIRAATRNPL